MRFSITIAFLVMAGLIFAGAGPTSAVAGNPPTVDLDAQPRNITEGESSALLWSSTNAENCVASGGWSGWRGTSGSELVFPTRLTTYTIVCTNEAGSSVGNVTVFVIRPNEGTPTVRLDVNPTRVSPGTAVTLVWSSTNADACLASGGWSGTKTTAGAETVTPQAQTTYTLICSNDNEVISASRTVFIDLTVSAPPAAPPAAPTPPPPAVSPAPAPAAAPAPPTAKPTPTQKTEPEPLTFKNIAPSSAEAPVGGRPLMAQIFGGGLGRFLGITFLILLNSALVFLLVWLYQRTLLSRN